MARLSKWSPVEYIRGVAKRTYFLHSPTASGALTGTAVVLWHGAGGDVDHPTLVSTVQAVVAEGGHAVRARFPYRVQGRHAPDRMPKLIASARELLGRLTAEPPLSGARLILGGRSMGGRMASMLAAEGFDVDGLMLLSYPLHPAGKKDKLRADHLSSIRCPMIFLQGTKDNMSDLSLLRPVVEGLNGRAKLEVFDKGDHSMKRVDPELVAAAACRWAISL
ncbi:MAG: alpha/beta family hydrolase [Myxococcota bacterium]